MSWWMCERLEKTHEMSFLKARIACAVASVISSQWLMNTRRSLFSLKRRCLGRSAEVHFFHQIDDPYSVLLTRYLPALLARYNIAIITHLVPPPEAAAAPDGQRLTEWSQRDASRLAANIAPPPASEAYPALDAPATSGLQAGAALRKKLGHYLGATLYFEGEWYWGCDRLHYLEQRLSEAGLYALNPAKFEAPAPLIPPKALQYTSIAVNTENRPVVHFYCSLRSPYTYLAVRQIRQLAEHYGAELRLRFVLPMVMRGLPVPLAKRIYILRDTKREALRQGFPFGAVVDPVGKPVEMGLAVLHAAMQKGHGSAFLEAFLEAAFAKGIDTADLNALYRLAQTAGLSEAEVDSALQDPSWRTVAEGNRAELLAGGLWGVPSFGVEGKPLLWGQDRLWMLEQDLKAQSQEK